MARDKKPSLHEQLANLMDLRKLRQVAEQYRSRGGIAGFAVRQLEIFVFTAKSIRGGEISRRAAALTYHTILGIVPVLAVVFALFKAFGGLHEFERPLRKMIMQNLAVGRAEEVGRWLDTFISNINAGAIAGVGVLILIYSAVSLLTNSERAFNRIWGIDQGRPLPLRVAIYTCLLILGPVLIGASISVSARLQGSAFAAAVVAWLPWGIGRLLLSLGSLLSVCVLFVLSYIIVPNTRVQFRSAVLGGLVAGLLWSAGKTLFFWMTAGSVKYSAIYGAFSALPLLMIWLYVSWVIVLFGVTYTYANQAASSGLLQEALATTSQSFRELLAVRMLTEIAAAFRVGGPQLTATALAAQLGASVGTVRHVLRVLLRHGLIAETNTGAAEDGYLPGKDIASLTVQDIVETLRQRDGAWVDLKSNENHQRVTTLMRAAAEAEKAVLAGATVRDLTEDSTPADSADSNE